MSNEKQRVFVFTMMEKEPKGWKRGFLEENFDSWEVISLSSNLSQEDQKAMAKMIEGTAVLICGNFVELKNELLKKGVKVYDLDL